LVEVATHQADTLAVHDVDRRDDQHPSILAFETSFWGYL
jgi:hypothetical protein